MYHKAYGIIETLAPLHVGASAGEETGNLNLIFRDQFTQTGIIPGSSIRGRFRADMRQRYGKDLANIWYGHDSDPDEDSERSEASANSSSVKERTTEALVKFEHASIVWLPVFCPGQPIVWISCPRLLKRYKQIAGIKESVPMPTGEPKKYRVKLKKHRDRLFFNLGFLDGLEDAPELSEWMPKDTISDPDNLVVIDDIDMSVIHDMALYRQTRTKLRDGVKTVENFFGFEALPEGCILIFPAAIKQEIPQSIKSQISKIEQSETWQPLDQNVSRELYFGGLESIGCGRCTVNLSGNYFKLLRRNEDVKNHGLASV
jgi:CRISPR-associated protein Cmr4